jgi:selenocysteine-specific elongation factor
MAIRAVPHRVLNAMIGTAGHVHHGKSSLVELLTGCSMNRLPEEKARLLTIGLGFAPCLLPGGRLVGIVDVPGHRDFIRNMVAGSASIDVLMLVVAADDGVMPQTLEHLRIVNLLSRPRLMVVLSKIDLVDERRRAEATESVREFLRRAGFADAPLIPLSNTTFEGLDEVRETLERLISEVPPRMAGNGRFRMNIERIFSSEGHGTVVTGIPTAGRVSVGDEVEILPGAQRTAVRAIQTYKLDAESAGPHACAAINLRDAARDTLARGAAIASVGAFETTSAAVVQVRNASTSTKLKTLSGVQLHAGTGAVNASLRLYYRDVLMPGEQGFGDVQLAQPFVLATGDRFILRQPSPSDTVAGGVVLSSRVLRRTRADAERIHRLEGAFVAVEAGDMLASEMLAGPTPVMASAEAERYSQLVPAAARGDVAGKVEAGQLIDLGGGGLLVKDRLSELAASVRKALSRYHDANKHEYGMPARDVARIVGLTERTAPGICGALASLAGFAQRHGRLALSEFSPALSAKQMEWRQGLAAALEEAGARTVARGTVAADLGIPDGDMKLLSRLLVEDGTMVVLGNHLISSSAFDECRRKLRGLFESTESVDVSSYRNATGMSRNVAIVALEAFDAEGLTRRVENGRVLVRKTDR